MTEAKTCKIEGCKRPYRAKGYCNVHFTKWRKGELDKNPRYKSCTEESCNKPMFSQGICQQHYEALLASKKKAAEGEAATTPVVDTAKTPKEEVKEAAPEKPAEEPKEEVKEAAPAEEKKEEPKAEEAATPKEEKTAEEAK